MRVTVRQGDSLWLYSQIFNLPFRLIIDSNRGINPNQLYIGQQVNIPGFIVSTHIIRQGDSLWRIAKDKGISLESLFLLNPEVNPQALYIGQTIQVPERVTQTIVNPQRNYDYTAMVEELQQLMDIYPFMIRESIGTSVMGKEIPELRIGVGNKQVHLNGSFHAQEWITTAVIMKSLNEYLVALTNGTAIRGLFMAPFYESVMLSIVPMVNPDGVNLVINGAPEEEPYRSQVLQINQGRTDFSNWKANIRGVDLNNQFPALWEVEKERKPQQPEPRDYPGEAPLTEPESIAMAELTRNSDFSRVLAYHTQGEVIYWGYRDLEPPEAETIVNEFARVSGYEPIQTIDSHAGFKDWFIQEWRRPGYTLELGEGVNPLPIEQFNEIYEESLGIFLASLYM